MAQAEPTVQKHSTAIISAGANLPSRYGEPYRTVSAALAAIGEALGRIVSVSRFFQTPAYPPGSGPDFVNAACVIATDLAPADILAGLHAIEADADRRRETRWGARTLDLDLIAVADMVLPDPSFQKAWMGLPPERQGAEAPPVLILPHPRLQDRAFVLIPLADIAPDWRHPVTGFSVRDMLAALPEADKAAICPC
ncbi:MAG: 2-amino-4-hydroxy-6-hydroxymethyldihydropteridine diphosphokinase [Proteobacteria bacterium]|nr:2-amino-4-hydroxy-6-hydroxymethyldihydropteridine diphosphokinase [Pseudomonadota bacterium]